MDVAGLLLLDDKLPQSVWRTSTPPQKKKIYPVNDGRSSVEINSILPSTNPKYRSLAHETFLQNGARTVDTFVRAVKKLFMLRYFNYEVFCGNAVRWH